MNVHETESAIAQSIATIIPERKLFPSRPGYGTLGQQNILHSNYLSLTLSDTPIFCYKIHIESTGSGQIPKANVTRRMIYRLLAQQFRTQLPHIATDYLSVVISCVDIPWARTYRVTDAGAVRGPRIFPIRTYKVLFSPTGTLSSRKVMSFLNATDHEVDLHTQCQTMQVLNVILRHFARKKSGSFGAVMNSNFYVCPGSEGPSPSGYFLEQLHHQSIKAHAVAARILVHVETQCIPCHPPGLLSTMIREYMSHQQSKMDRLEKILRHVRVQIVISAQNHQGQSFRKAVQIRGLASRTDGALQQHPPRVARYGAGPQEVEIFIEPQQILDAASPLQRGYVTLSAYFEKGWLFCAPHHSNDVADEIEHNMTLSPDLPVVNTGTAQRPVYFPAETCIVQAGQLATAAPVSAHGYRPIHGQAKNPTARAKKSLSVVGSNSHFNPVLVRVHPTVLSQTFSLKYRLL